jgi:hypothetical protein
LLAFAADTVASALVTCEIFLMLRMRLFNSLSVATVSGSWLLVVGC